MTKSVTFESRHDGKITVKVGDVVGFKCDIEQYGKVIAIEERPVWDGGIRFTVENKNGFDGGYIGGQRKTVVYADDIWVD